MFPVRKHYSVHYVYRYNFFYTSKKNCDFHTFDNNYPHWLQAIELMKMCTDNCVSPLSLSVCKNVLFSMAYAK